MLEHILGGIEYAAGLSVGDCRATIDSNFQKTVLDSAVNQPMKLARRQVARAFGLAAATLEDWERLVNPFTFPETPRRKTDG